MHGLRSFLSRRRTNSRAASGSKKTRDALTPRAFSASSLGIVKGSTITLVADGADEQEAIDTLTALINSDFSE